MELLVAGLGVWLLTALLFWVLLPRGGRPHRLVNTEFEPYVAVILTGLIALGFTMILSGALSYFS
jgi:Zn-dependent protease with chaperone function